MTASMILWTLELLDWVHGQLGNRWPGVKLRGGAPDIYPEPYRIRFRENGNQYWLVLSREAIRSAGVAEVASLLEANDWISILQETGGVSVGLDESTNSRPVLIPWPALGPERRWEASA